MLYIFNKILRMYYENLIISINNIHNFFNIAQMDNISLTTKIPSTLKTPRKVVKTENVMTQLRNFVLVCPRYLHLYELGNALNFRRQPKVCGLIAVIKLTGDLLINH